MTPEAEGHLLSTLSTIQSTLDILVVQVQGQSKRLADHGSRLTRLECDSFTPPPQTPDGARVHKPSRSPRALRWVQSSLMLLIRLAFVAVFVFGASLVLFPGEEPCTLQAFIGLTILGACIAGIDAKLPDALRRLIGGGPTPPAAIGLAITVATLLGSTG
jgi:hypothetical protein